jgi:hypothetical protein
MADNYFENYLVDFEFKNTICHKCSKNTNSNDAYNTVEIKKSKSVILSFCCSSCMDDHTELN